MIAAAEAFLVAVEEAQTALWGEQESAHEVFEVKAEASALAVRVQEVATPAETAGQNLSRMPNALASHKRALLMIQRVSEATDGQHNALDTGRRAEVGLALEAAEEAVRHAEDDLVGTPLAPLAPLLRESLRNQSRAVTALQGRGDKNRVLIACIYRVHGAVARVVLSFPAVGSVSEVADRAEVVKGLFIDAARAVNQATMAEADSFSDTETARLIRELTTAREEFARAANLEIGKQRWPWKKYGQ